MSPLCHTRRINWKLGLLVKVFSFQWKYRDESEKPNSIWEDPILKVKHHLYWHLNPRPLNTTRAVQLNNVQYNTQHK